LDALIGSTVIDLENRRHSDVLFQNRKSCDLRLKEIQKEINTEQSKNVSGKDAKMK
jgi:hypothetical protein